MTVSLFEVLTKDKAAQTKWDMLSQYEKDLVSMRFVVAMLVKNEYMKVTTYKDKPMADGRVMSILHFELGLGEFVFAIPKYMDSVLILVDFDIVEEILADEGWQSATAH